MHIKNARNIFLSIPKAEKKATLFTQIAQSALKTKKKRISFKFCPHKEFISHEQKEAHKKNAHKQIAQSALKTKKKRTSFKFCPHKEFISHEQKEAHKKNAHKKCNCSWGQYFPTREEFLDHFYSVHPIPSRKRQMPSEMSVSFLPGIKSQRFSQFAESVLLCCLSEEKDWERISTGDKDVFQRWQKLAYARLFLGSQWNWIVSARFSRWCTESDRDGGYTKKISYKNLLEFKPLLRGASQKIGL